MIDPLTLEEETTLRANHTEQTLALSLGRYRHVCYACEDPWPCDTARILATLDTARSDTAALVDGARIVADYLDTLLTAESMSMSSILRHGIREATDD